ncbi:RnfABCDGE type electron transport complex subunit D [Thiohalorhabdus methylotrophus]|uniref:Ion-translocating oxidoreductase complex subunit D n=1 Tax=Thiohalorhabdus methylotrophus TaxID=3242694 RepID=A0ABV4TQR6_9GAMM
MAQSTTPSLATPSSPHAHGGGGVGSVMGTVIIALAPVTLFSFYLFGWPVLFMLLTTLAAGLATEAFALWLMGRPIRPHLMDGSAVVTCLLLGLSLPASAPWWIAVLGGAFAIGVGKQVYGGLGANPFNPAMISRVMLLISFPQQLSTWPAIRPLFSEGALSFTEGLRVTFLGERGPALGMDAASAATPLGHLKTELTLSRTVDEILGQGYDHTMALFGTLSGSAGETSAVLILLGGLYMWWRGIIDLRIPGSMIAATAALAFVFHVYDPSAFPGPVFHVFNGALLLGAFFIATDMVTSPTTPRGQILFGLGCGALTYIIRTWGGYPEGVSFAVVLMNACVPLIDHYTRPRVFGKERAGGPPLGGAE